MLNIMRDETTIYRDYLLGNLETAESEKIDKSIISGRLADDLALAESDLIEDYLENKLSGAELELFRTNFMVSRARREHLDEIMLLKSHALGLDLAGSDDGRARGILGRPIAAYFRPLVVGTAIAAAILIAALIWSGYLGVSSLEREYAELNNRDLNFSEINNYSSVQLVHGPLRDANSVVRLKGDALTESLLFRLAVATHAAPEIELKATVYRGSGRVFAVDKIGVYKNASGREARLLLPRRIFTPGEYRIVIDDTSGLNVGTYGLLIE